MHWTILSNLSHYHLHHLCLLSPDSCSQLVGLPGVPPGQHGPQLSPHTAAGDQSPDRPSPVFTGRLRERHLQDEQLVHCYRQIAGEETGGEHGHALQVRDRQSLYMHTSPKYLNTPTCSQSYAKIKCLFTQTLIQAFSHTHMLQYVTPHKITTFMFYYRLKIKCVNEWKLELLAGIFSFGQRQTSCVPTSAVPVLS